MKRTFGFLLAGLLLLPAAAAAQVEIGMDGGVTIDNFDGDGDNYTTVAFPASWFRVAFPAGEMISVETLATIERESIGDFSLTSILLLPGVNFAIGESGLYVRGEAGLRRISDEDSGATQFLVGGAVGMTSAIKDGPVFFRLEGGLGKGLDNDDFNGVLRIRILAGLSVTLN